MSTTASQDGDSQFVEALLVGSGVINFEFLAQRLGSKEAARVEFERLVEDIVGLVHPDVHAIRANPGDWGIDAFVGQLGRGGTAVVWQAKYYIDEFGKTQQADVRESYSSAKAAAQREGYRLEAWTLCVPCSLDGPTMKWWQGWVKRNAHDGVAKELWDEGMLRRRILGENARHIQQSYFQPVVSIPTGGESQPDRALLELEDETRYQDALFVRQMHEANLMETREASESFFNAEILAQEIQDKGVPGELRSLQNWRVRVAATWSNHFNDASQSATTRQLPGLFQDVMSAIEERHSSEAASLRASPVHGFGLMHQRVENEQAGWVRDWRDVAADRTSLRGRRASKMGPKSPEEVSEQITIFPQQGPTGFVPVAGESSEELPDDSGSDGEGVLA